MIPVPTSLLLIQTAMRSGRCNMGETIRQAKYNIFWSWCRYEWMYEGTIDMLLKLLPDEQLDELVAEISKGKLRSDKNKQQE